MPIESSLLFDPKSKQFGIRPDFDAFIPFWLTVDPPNQSLTVAAASQTPGYAMSYRYAGPFVGYYLQYSADRNDLLVKIVDGRDGYAYTMRGKNVHLQTIASNQPGFPAILPEHLVLQHRSSIVVNLQNLDPANAATIRFLVQGYAFEPSRIRTEAMSTKVKSLLDRQTYIRPHFAPLDDEYARVANGTTNRFYLTVDDAGYFEVFKLNAVAYQQGTVTPLTAAQQRGVLLNIFDYSGRQISNAAQPDIPLDIIAGSGPNPNIWPARIMYPPKAQIAVEVTNGSGVNIDLYLTFIGRRIYAPDIWTPPSEGYAK